LSIGANVSDGGVGSVVANDRAGGENSVVVTTLYIIVNDLEQCFWLNNIAKLTAHDFQLECTN